VLNNGAGNLITAVSGINLTFINSEFMGDKALIMVFPETV
jgi:hypothetical protein